VDVFARTALIHNYAATSAENQTAATLNWILENLPWIQCVIVKTRNALTDKEKRGIIIHGREPDHKIFENGVWYAIDLTMNRDASIYLDTRNLRTWAKQNLEGKTVLNTFAYTGSLGVAALAGGAARVIQLDRNHSFLKLAKISCALNDFPVRNQEFVEEDFFPAISRFKHSGQLFDCVFLDPPFFSSTSKGKVDLEAGSRKLINKIRPLIKHNGWLVAINNALFLSGRDYIASLEALCKDGYISIEKLIPVSSDFTGTPQTRIGNPPADPAPFNHSTKIAILSVRRKPEE
jgi:23S rRNA (cytosine1962-C5)-methyltransferase